jgi:hypothetical protein
MISIIAFLLRRLPALLFLLLGTPSFTAETGNREAPAMDFFKGEPDTGYPPSSPLLVNARGRDYQSLNGLWDIIIDEAGIGRRMITAGDYYDEGVRFPDTGGYTAFNFDITDFLRSGKNSLKVRVDAFLDDSTVPTI